MIHSTRSWSRSRSSILSLSPPESTMPNDMVLPVYLSNQDMVCRTSLKTCEPALRFQMAQLQPEDGGTATKGKVKKRVTFADHRGLSLTRVKVFSPLSDPIHIPLNVQEMLSSAASLTGSAAAAAAAEEDQLVLDFAQPSSDYLHFRQSLERNSVCLEHCVLTEKALAGTVKVRNVSFEKSVTMRVTFDAWKSHTDVACVYVKDAYPSSYSNTFSFKVSLPQELLAHERVEFAVCYQAGGCEYWDNNQGNNYRVVWSSMKRSHQDADHRHTDSFDFGIHFDRYGSPTCTHGIFPDWPSYAGYEDIGPYY